MTDETSHEAVDFFSMPPSNEQIIIATLERIEQLLIAHFAPKSTQVPNTPEPLEARKGKIDALMSRTGTRRK